MTFIPLNTILHDTTQYLVPYTLPLLSILFLCIYIYYTAATLPRGTKLVSPAYIPYFGVLLDVIRHWDIAHDRVLYTSRLIGEKNSYSWSIPKLFGGRPVSCITLGATEANAEHILKSNMQNYIKGIVICVLISMGCIIDIELHILTARYSTYFW